MLNQKLMNRTNMYLTRKGFTSRNARPRPIKNAFIYICKHTTEQYRALNNEHKHNISRK